MIDERYCSLELSLMLKQEGFDEICMSYYQTDAEKPEKVIVNSSWLVCNSDCQKYYKNIIAAPTHQMAMDWIRENRGLHIGVLLNNDYPKKYEIHIVDTDASDAVVLSTQEGVENYGKVCEIAIKHALKEWISYEDII